MTTEASTQHNTISPGNRRGYVLLTVIAVSVLVVTTLSALASLSLRRSIEATDAERSLQQRWGALTLQRTLLQRAPTYFETQQEIYAERFPGTVPPSKVRAVIRLGDTTFDVLVADEDAKVNLNTVFHRAGMDRVRESIPRVAGPAVGRAVRLMPAVKPMQIAREERRLSINPDDEPDEEEFVIPDAFRSWGEVFDLNLLQAGFARDASLPNLTTEITCWGNGQLNFRRASDEAILAVSRCVVQDGVARRIIQRYRENPTAALETMLQTEVSNERDRERMGEVLSETSTNFSVWIDAATNGGDSLRTFAVTKRDDEGVTRQVKFRH